MDKPLRELAALQSFVLDHPRLFVLTGAGCSTASGIPDYRDAGGAWKRKPPVTIQAFRDSALTRARYWARSFVGWPYFGHVQANTAHHALTALQTQGRIARLLTQNVDRLHQKAGSREVIDLHGRLDEVICLSCGLREAREAYQQTLIERNPDWLGLSADYAPDGDADLDELDFSTFGVPDCPRCGGLIKPDVVFFGENVPKSRVDEAMSALVAADALLVVGSSLMVYSGYRFAVAAARHGLPIAAINLGVTRADSLLSLKAVAACDLVLPMLSALLSS
ncbi:NAD-dependent protein deacetylase [Banduia mediterranea]|uniref:NAD-dependent protein deacetylase n=1 Tax=Banduia mediterranea TaxID=3075609 RepID=UPI0032C21859